MSLPAIHPETTASGIAIDPKTLDRVVPATRRADGTLRKELKIRPGFTPQEDAARFRSARQLDTDQNALPKGRIPGWVPPSSESSKAKRGGRGGAAGASSGGRSLEALASGHANLLATTKTEAPLSKSAKKNAKRGEKKREDKQKTLEDKIRASWDEDSEDDIPRPAKKGKAPAQAPTASDEGVAAGSEDESNVPKDADDGTGDVTEKVADLTV